MAKQFQTAESLAETLGTSTQAVYSLAHRYTGKVSVKKQGGKSVYHIPPEVLAKYKPRNPGTKTRGKAKRKAATAKNPPKVQTVEAAESLEQLLTAAANIGGENERLRGTLRNIRDQINDVLGG